MSENGQTAKTTLAGARGDMEILASGADVDIETLMSRIRQHVNATRTPTPVENTSGTGTQIAEAFEAQADFNRDLTKALQTLAQRLTQLEEQRRAQDAQTARNIQTIEQTNARLDEHEAHSGRATQELTLRLNDHIARSADPLALWGAQVSRLFDYFLFEHEFRGTSQDIKQRQRAYLALFRDKENVLDLGCGRGEFVELLTENGIPVTGVDADQAMIDFCRERGLRVERADLFEYLERLPASTIDGIFVAQVIEHLAPEKIVTLLRLCADKMLPGGMVVLETVNPHCPLALGNFYLDPSHVRPVPPRLLEFLLKQASFHVQFMEFSSPVPTSQGAASLHLTAELPEQINLYQDYAVIAVRTLK